MSIRRRIERLESARVPRDAVCQIIMTDLDCKNDCESCDRTPIVSEVPSILVCKPKAEVNHESA